MKKNILLILGVAAVVGIATLALLRQSPQSTIGTVTGAANGAGSVSTPDAISSGESIAQKDNKAVVGAVSKNSEKTQGGSKLAETENPKKSDDPFDYGKTPPVKGGANENVKSVVEAVRSKKNPERLSVLINPKPFDPEAYLQNPQFYLNTIEPARAHTPKQPGKGVVRISPLGETRAQIKQNGSVLLRVKAHPKFPVAWTSHDGGKFSNELNSITVEADENGIAEARFFGAPGTIEDVHIVCASPMCSGQVRYTINVTKAE